MCPDGSVFIVQSEASIPCERAKRVEPHEVPPLRPDYLPKPYTWQVYGESVDPNNPYNMIDSARKVRALQQGGGPPPEAALPQVGAPPPPVTRAQRAPRSLEPETLGLSDGELRDLFLIVELSQERAPANFVKETADGLERMRVSLAHSQSFEDRVAASWGAGAGSMQGRVLLFTVVAQAQESFFGNFTFTQGHFAFQPDREDPRQMGVLHGRFGPLSHGETLLGYVVVPRDVDFAAPADVYWNDRRTTATFSPAS
ncbi:MAG: hypothetical protein JSU66_13805 [Deltaproteobacteria bacterium]|nr:MAG: hypothetical protein JSU66_13805 [Deltaproteobacteria bacterium]